MATQLLVSNGTLIDGTGAAAQPSTSVLIDGTTVVAIGDEADRRAQAAEAAGVDTRRIDATGATVMPGLVDVHTHLTLGEPNSNDELFFHRTPAHAAMVAAFNVQKVLRAGVTSCLDADGLFEIGPALRDCIDAGIVEGPRIASGMFALLTAVGGTAGRLIPDRGMLGYAMVVATRDEMVQETRRQIKHGADWVKIHATGLVPGRQGELQVWTLDEMRTVCDTAHDLGVPVTAHCRSASSTRDAARAGVDLILHASFMDDEAVEAVVESGAAVAPTFTFLANLVEFGAKVGATPAVIDLFRNEIEASAPMIRKAHDAGTTLMCGSEAGFSLTPYGHWHARELDLFVRYLGLTPLEAVTCGTRNGGRAIARGRPGMQIGTLAPGWVGDLLVVDGDPMADLGVLCDRSRLRAVVKDGRPVDLARPWPQRDTLPGEKVGTYGSQVLTWELVNS